MSEENTKVMSKDDFAVYSAKVNEWVETTTPLIEAIKSKKDRSFAEFDMQQIVRLLAAMSDEPSLDIKQRIHLAGKMFPVGIWPFVRGRGSTLDPETQLIVDNHDAVAEKVFTAIWALADSDSENYIEGAENLSLFRLSGRADENPYGRITEGKDFIGAKRNAEKQGLMSKHRNKIWDGNADMNWNVVGNDASDSNPKESAE
tara:strand:- start:635 stop:1240 length:606 start_codon:yes stop_codon:yes gene_type:complete